MNTILLVAVGVALGLFAFAVMKKLIKLAVVLGVLIFMGLLGWYAIEEHAPAGTSDKIEAAADKVGKATGEAAKKVSDKAAPVVEKAAKAVTDKAGPIVEKAAKKGAELADKVADKVVETVSEELTKVGQGDDDDSASP
jgi:predicted lipid-binding transport protein (Tim44 family)